VGTIRDRIKELRRVRAGDLVANPRNWRTHPTSQRTALQAMLKEIGWADASIARELPDGQLQLIDGHLRADLDAEAEVPVLVVDLDEGEAEKLLLTLDPMAALAGTNRDVLKDLLDRAASESDDVMAFLREVGESRGVMPPTFAPADAGQQGALDHLDPITCPHCGESFEPVR
jgi:hypothetical protein